MIQENELSDLDMVDQDVDFINLINVEKSDVYNVSIKYIRK